MNERARRVRILVIDDDPTDRALMRRELLGHFSDLDLHEVADDAGFRKALEEPPYDVVVTDYQLKWNDGLEVLKAIKARHPQVPVVMFTGSGTEEIAVEAMKSGLSDYLVKSRKGYRLLPFAIDAVLDATRHKARLRKTEEDLRRAIRVRDEFVSLAAHEMRTPVAALVLKAGAMARALRGSTHEPRANDLLRVTGRVADLVNVLLEAATFEEETLLNKQPLDVTAVVTEVVDEMSELLSQGGSKVALTTTGPLPAVSDRVRLEQIVRNLLVNALKFGRGKPIEVKVAQVEGQAEITVRDFGMGISEQDFTRIFERFERASSENYGGFGLGLWFVRELTRALGGTVHVTSKVGDGAAFTVRLPL